MLTLLVVSLGWSAGFRVLKADTRLVRGVYLLDARLNYDLSNDVAKALLSGVPLTIELEIEVLRNRTWLWDETVASLVQRYRLEYHALAEQYVITNLNSGLLKSFPTRGTAIDYIEHIRNFPLLDRSLLNPTEIYHARLRVSLDIESLPTPLRPVAYLSSDWRLGSEWYAWPL